MCVNPLKPELNPICYLLALLGAHHFLHVSSVRVKSLTFRRLMSYIYIYIYIYIYMTVAQGLKDVSIVSPRIVLNILSKWSSFLLEALIRQEDLRIFGRRDTKQSSYKGKGQVSGSLQIGMIVSLPIRISVQWMPLDRLLPALTSVPVTY